jgi:hypothetical protein
MRAFLCLIIMLSLFACSHGKPGGTEDGDGSDASVAASDNSAAASTAPVEPRPESAMGKYSLEVVPEEAYVGSTLGLKALGFDPSDAGVSWLLNGRPASTLAPYSFEVAELGAKKGDTLQAKARIGGREIESNKVVIRNSLPEITRVKLEPEVFRQGDSIRLEAEAEDPDGDEVAISYEWTINGYPAGSGKGPEAPFKKGDSISVRATPFDGEEHGRAVVLERKVGNQPPMITEHYDYGLEGEVYTYQVKAEDPDGDALTYSLKSAPDGMSIGAETGLVSWVLPEDFNGKARFTVSVSDGQGAEAEQALTLTVNKE